jgi:integrase
MPPRPGATGDRDTPVEAVAALPVPADDRIYQRIAADLRGAIECGALAAGMPLPSEKELAGRYRVAASTAHRAVSVLVAAGLVTSARGRRAVANSDAGSAATFSAERQSRRSGRTPGLTSFHRGTARR